MSVAPTPTASSCSNAADDTETVQWFVNLKAVIRVGVSSQDMAFAMIAWCRENMLNEQYLYYWESPFAHSVDVLVFYLAEKKDAAAFMLIHAEHVLSVKHLSG